MKTRVSSSVLTHSGRSIVAEVGMGKYTKKGKMTSDVALTDVSQSYLGVRTHTKTLALHRLPSAALPPSNPDACYLDLRSRRLEKTHMQPCNSRNTRRSCGKEPAGIGRHETEGEGLGIEASVEENNLDFDVRERDTKERSQNTEIVTISSWTCSSEASQRVQNAHLVINAPSAYELEEFFAREERSMQHHFIEKYNFDIVQDLPLHGRYEWVAVRP